MSGLGEGRGPRERAGEGGTLRVRWEGGQVGVHLGLDDLPPPLGGGTLRGGVPPL